MSGPADASAPRWSARQRAMLREMGLRPGALPGLVGSPGPSPVPVPVPTAAPAADRAEPWVPQERPAQRAAEAGALADASPARLAPVADPPAPVAVPMAAGMASASTSITATATATLGWTELRQAVSGCQACRLCEGRTQTVFGTGSPRARWMVVGEAPGEEEDRRGEPFVGKSGQLLDAMLSALGLSRADDAPPERAVYIANAVKCRPPGNRNPQPDELARCESYLLRQVSLLRPSLILAMGRFAVQSLLRSDEPIGRLRGRVHDYQGVPLVVTYHPAYLLRSPQEKARAWEDLCLARSRFESRASGAADAPAARPGPAAVGSRN